MSDWWHNPMPEETARRVLGTEHFDYVVERGAAYCSSRAAGSWYANLQESFGAYKAAERIAMERR